MSVAPRAVRPGVNSWNAEFLEAEYERFRRDPDSVPADLRSFFQGFELGLTNPIGGGSGGGGGSNGSASGFQREASPVGSSAYPGAGGRGLAGAASPLQARADAVIAVYRGLGHMGSKLDPFGRDEPRPPALHLSYHGISDADLNQAVDATAIGLSVETPLREVVSYLERVYCGTIGVEFMHVQDRDEREWLLEWFESRGGRLSLDRGVRAHILEQLVRAELFEKFLGKRYPGEKRFSLEGGESLIPLLDRLIESGSELGVEEVVLGMAHRGRLNVLNNILGKTYEQIFTEFEDNWEEDFVDGGGDVKYHRGYSGARAYDDGRKVHLAMASNPSHLEAVGPVVHGRTRAKQRLRADTERRRVIPVLVHGDAAVIGQGIVPELLNMSQLEGYTTGGCVHVVVNNQIGFTTLPRDARSSRYCTDVAKMIEAPVLHVNGEDPEAVVACAQLAIEYRQRFRKDVFIDMVCYRKYGHNEQDEQSFTQPVLAGLIKKKEGVLTSYAHQLRDEGVLNDSDMEAIRTRFDRALELAQESARQKPHDPTIDPGSARWAGMSTRFSHEATDTSISSETLREVAQAMGRVPEGFEVNKKLKKLMTERAAIPETELISYADCESLAFGSLLLEGHGIRLSGQDSRRGTFSHRHAVLFDANQANAHVPLNHIREMGVVGTEDAPGTPGSDGRPRQGRFCVYDSPLSEAGVMAFDYGYALSDPSMLVMWEAQFGDFVNGAQVIIDQFLASAEMKWQRWNGLVLLLPHGYEGAGPEHSSARMERFLELCGDNNLQVIYPSTGAQIFHALRRQVKRDFRKPLIVMTPKSMLRVPTSRPQELVEGRFREVIDDPAFEERGGERGKVERLLFCTGKIYHELADRRSELGRDDVAIVRFEQLYPFHTELAKEIIGRYENVSRRIWVQEEPRNMGAYHHVDDICREKLGIGDLRYIGRETSASPAVGSKTVHKQEQEAIVSGAIGPKPDQDGTPVRRVSGKVVASL
ncbi:MAG: 2-oxoglutarate dehydrogenase E1 component [Phycisphaerales bacterium]|nr:MAG: 2-oxoglutarate dehydrogenase E1 component [Phycisphaerales bacterium]